MKVATVTVVWMIILMNLGTPSHMQWCDNALLYLQVCWEGTGRAYAALSQDNCSMTLLSAAFAEFRRKGTLINGMPSIKGQTLHIFVS